MNRSVSLILTSFYFVGCNSPHADEQSFVWNKNTDFQTGFYVKSGQKEVINEEEYACFGDFQSQKEFALHPITGGDEIRVDLSKIIEAGNAVQAVEFINEDTVLVLTEHTNRLFMINARGDVWREIELNPYLEEQGRFRLQRSLTPFQFNDTTLIFTLSFQIESLPLNDWNNLDLFYEKRYASPMLFKVANIFEDTLDVQFGLKNLYTNFINDDCVALDGGGFTFFKDHIIFKSIYSDTLYKIDPATLEINQKAPVHSVYGDLRTKALTIEEDLRDPTAHKKNFQDGQLRRVFYDDKSERYFVMVAHHWIGTEAKHENRPWSIIVLDKELNLRNEIKMDETKWAPSGIMTEQGLLISRANEAQSESDHFSKNAYGLFNYK